MWKTIFDNKNHKWLFIYRIKDLRYYVRYQPLGLVLYMVAA